MTPPPSGRGRAAGATRDQVLQHAVREFRACRRVDVQSIAADLAVGRTTIHRWFGGRDGLLGEILRTQFIAVFDGAVAASPGGADAPARILAALDSASRRLAASKPLRRFLAEEQALALRLITVSEGPVHCAVMERVESLIDDAARSDPAWRQPLTTQVLAYSLVRISEAFLYNDAVIGRQSNIQHLHQVMAALIGGPPLEA